MENKFKGKFEASGRVGLRDSKSRELVAVYPYKAEGADNEVEEKVRYWFYQRSCEAENQMDHYFVDTLNPVEFRNAQEKFLD
ncbi:MAG: hypothetical protein Q8942_18785 [Bacillota bacterium]|nr:hypothetical protein [Bacillota bacterium]